MYIKIAIVVVLEYAIIVYAIQEGINEIRKMKEENKPLQESCIEQ